jgi:ubiquinone/menaquinone biosynthesis C-methylase UbiE
MIRRVVKFARLVWERGPAWVVLYGLRAQFLRWTPAVNRRLIELEQRRFIVGKSTVSSASHTEWDNRSVWDSYDWSRRGEEWTTSPEWKRALVDGLLSRHVRPGSTVLEIGPGAGRWSEILQPLARRLVLVDVSPACLASCRQRFETCTNVEYRLASGSRLSFLDDSSVDFIWSYDVFVHINPVDTERYLEEFERVLVPGGYGVIHHPGTTYASPEDRKSGWRSHMTDRLFARLAAKAHLQVVEQSGALVHRQGDVITVITKPGGRNPSPAKVIE